MKSFYLIICVFAFPLIAWNAFSQKNEKSENINVDRQTIVFLPGEDGFDFFRIPAILRAGDQLLAFAEGRKNSLSDHGQIDIVMKTSKDQGRSWSDLIRVTHYENQSCQNPTPVYIPEENKLILLFTRRTVASDTEDMIRAGTAEGYIGAYAVMSRDMGMTWGAVREITDDVKLPDWRWYAFGPGGAIIVKYNNDHTGRIIAPANHSTSGGQENEFLGAHVIYSDDNGDTWKIGAIDSKGSGNINPNETAVVETRSGTLYFNTRSQYFGDKAISNRAITLSNDGGENYVHPFSPEPQLLTPVVHASLLRTENSVYFVAPNHPQERQNLSIWISRDETLTWDTPETIYNEFAAYSSCVMLDDRKLGIMAETGNENPYQEIRFFVIDPDN